LRPAIFARHGTAFDGGRLAQAFAECSHLGSPLCWCFTVEKPNYRHRRLLRARRERPRRRHAAERGQQLPPSDGDCHAPLPREVRERKDTTPWACSLHVQGGQNAGCFRPQSSASTATIPAASSWRTSSSPPRASARRCTAAPERQYLASLRSGLWDLLANDYAATYLDASFVAAISSRRRNVG